MSHAYEEFFLNQLFRVDYQYFELQLKTLPSSFFRILQARDGLDWALFVDFLIEIFSRSKNNLLDRDFF